MTIWSQIGQVLLAIKGGQSRSPTFTAQQSAFQAAGSGTIWGVLHDHGPNTFADAPITGSSPRIATPGLLPPLGRDDGALTGSATVTYPAGSAISGTGDFTIAGLVAVGSADTLLLYDQATLQIRLILNGSQDRVSVFIAGTGVIDLLNAGITDSRAHLYVLRRFAGIVTLWVDGILVSTVTAAGSISAAAPTTQLTGGLPVVDEVAWWTRALTDNEIASLVAASPVLTGATGLLAGQWLQKNLPQFAFSAASIDPGSSMIDTPDLSTGDATGVLDQLAHAEDGMCFVDASGQLVFKGRNTIGGSTAIIGDGGGTEIPFVEPPGWSMDVDRVGNLIQVTKDGFATVVAQNTDSQTQYGKRALAWSANLLDGTQMSDASAWLLARYQTPQLRLDSLIVRGQGGYWPTLLALELGDRITVNHRPPGGTLLTAEVVVEHIQHQITPDDWVIVLQLAPVPDVFILDDPVFGQLDDDLLGWGAPWPRAFIVDDPVQGVLDAGYVLQ